MTELQQREKSTEDERKVLEMLQRVEATDDVEDEEEDWEDLDSDDDENEHADLAERLAEVDLNNADAIWEKLTDEEKQEFKSIVYNGEIEKIVQPVEPWWKLHLEEKAVVDLQEEELKVKEILKKCPKVPNDVKDFQKISSKPPAACIIYNIADLVGAYTYIFRYYNGDHLSYEMEATDTLISICDNLKANTNFESTIAVADSVMMSCLNLNLFSDLSSKNLMLEDLRSIFDGPGDDTHSHSFILSALSDTLQLFKTAKQKYRKDQPKSSSTSDGSKRKFSAEFVSGDGRTEFKQLENQTHFVGCIRKIEFYLSFVKFKYNKIDWPVSWDVE